MREENSKSPKVSVIMSSLNVAPYIRECIESVIKQTLQDIEIICIDAGSDDGTYEILQEYAGTDNRIKLIRSEEKSVGRQNNLGIEKAAGEYIGFVETDDYISPDMFEKLYAAAADNEAEAVRADYDIFFGNGNVREFIRRGIARGEDYDRICDPSEETVLFKNEMSVWAGIYKKSFLERNDIRHNESPGASYQDNGLWFQVMASVHRLVYIHPSLYRYRLDNPNSSVHSREKVYAICDEYGFIENRLKHRNLYNKSSGIFVYTKFVRYLYTYQRLSDEFKDEFSEAFHKEMLNHSKNGELKTELFSEKQMVLITAILAAAYTFRKVIDEQQKTLKQVLNGNNGIIQFGLGGDGIRFITYARDKGFIHRIAAITDNNSDLWGKNIFGVKIISPSEAVNLYPDDRYLVTSINYEEEISRQLKVTGIKEEWIDVINVV